MKYFVIGAISTFVAIIFVKFIDFHDRKKIFDKYCIQVDSLQNEIPSDAYLCGKEIEKIWA